ncbi:MAG: GspH/FimT family pseudopilin [Thiotrichaceae bacterium]
MNNKSNQSGFTLVELIVTVSILGILTAAAMPSLKTIFLKNTTIAYSNDFKMALYLAQNEAIKRNIQVTIKPTTASSTTWQDGWDIFEDTDNDGTQDTGEELIYSYTPSATNFTLKSETSSFDTSLAFNPMGEPIVATSGASSSGEFTLCGPDNDGLLARIIKVSFSGNIIINEGVSDTCS